MKAQISVERASVFETGIISIKYLLRMNVVLNSSKSQTSGHTHQETVHSVSISYVYS